MKPLKLMINAFGSYAACQIIDFSALGTNGLYLITGETGSGKTTIFDAVSFALFGKASGSSRGDYSMLRSDFADEKDRTCVELDFVSGSASYNIKRIIKKTGTSCGQEVSLLLPDGTSVSGDRNVKSKIDEIIGLDREQFSQIVMIAQNDFLRFLQSGTDDRLKILRRIFGTGKLKHFQEQLKIRAKQENEKRDLIVRDFNRYGVDIYKREEQFSQWDSQIKADKYKLAEIDKNIDQYDKIKKDLAVKLAGAEELSGKLNDLVSCRGLFKEHEEKAGENEKRKIKAALGEKALRKVKPFSDEAARTADSHAALFSAMESAKKQEISAFMELGQAEKILKELPVLSEAQAAFADLFKRCDASVERHKKLTGFLKDAEIIDKKEAALSAMQSEFEKYNTVFFNEDNKYKSLEEIFFRSQAGIIAKKLSDGEPCPVCGSLIHPNPAVISGENINGDVTETELNKAKERRDSAHKRCEEKSLECKGISAETAALKERFTGDLSEFASFAHYDAAKTELLKLLEQTYEEKENLIAEKSTAEKSLAELAGNWESAVKKKTDAESVYKSAQTLSAERGANEQEAAKLRAAALDGYKKALVSNNFSGETDYINALVTEDELSDITKELAAYDKNGELLIREINRLEKETSGKEKPDLEKLKTEAESANNEASELMKKREEIKSRLDKTESMLTELRQASVDFVKADKSCAAVKQLSDTANGKLDFETYAQLAYFEYVLMAANQRLKAMSQNRYTLLRKKDSGDGRVKTGLEIEAFDAYTGKARSAGSLSGGESFMASLSLALGLSDVVQQSAGGIRLDAMFIDEGFGTLDTETLDVAIKTLSEMAGSNRIIGIISHVNELRERVDKQIRIEKTTRGSRVIMMV